VRSDVAVDGVLEQYRTSPGDSAAMNQLLARVNVDAEELAGKPLDVITRWATGRVIPRLLGRVDPRIVLQHLIVTLREKVAEEQT
jgi:hypothetical protein